MKKIIESFLLLMLVAISLSAEADTKKGVYLDEEKQEERKVNRKINNPLCQKIRVAGFVTNPPFGWVTYKQVADKNYYINNGFAYDLFKKITKNINVKVENVGYKSYDEAMRDLRLGKIDVMAGSYYEKNILGINVNLLFPGIMNNPIIPIFVKGREKDISKFEDLKNLKGVVRQEELIYPLIYKRLPKEADIKEVSGSKKAFTMLLSGEVDYMLSSLYSAEAEVRRYKLVDEIHFHNKALLKPELFFVFSKHSSCSIYKNTLTQELTNLKKNEKEYNNFFISYIDNWGQTFKDDEGLIETVRKEMENKREK